MRLAVYCDYSYRLDGDELYAELPFGIFLNELARQCERLVVIGRQDPTPGRFPFRMRGVAYVPLPYYRSGADLAAVMRAVPSSMRRFWRALDDVDTLWILGPNPPQAIAFALLGLVRRRRVVLGVRQHLPKLIRHRHPRRPPVWLAAYVLEAAFRLLGRAVPVVAVGGDLAERYRKSPAVHTVYVSLLTDDDLATAAGEERDYENDGLRVLTVGRLDPEKNPLLLADILAQLARADARWQMDICGEGSLEADLDQRLRELGVREHATLHGYVPIDDGLWDLYRRSHVLLHVSFTEGVPQVLLEAFAAGLPVVATAVGGVAELVGGRGLLVAPGDADAAAEAVAQLVANPELRRTLVERGRDAARAHTLESECSRLVAFLSPGA